MCASLSNCKGDCLPAETPVWRRGQLTNISVPASCDISVPARRDIPVMARRDTVQICPS
jgi:hypothetical protein